MTDIPDSELYQHAEAGSWRSQVDHHAADLAERVLKHEEPLKEFDRLVIQQSRPKNWYHTHWKDHVWNKFLEAYQDRRRFDGHNKDKAAVLAFFDATVYALTQPDKPSEFRNMHGWYRYR